jgi:hypothetical protein
MFNDILIQNGCKAVFRGDEPDNTEMITEKWLKGEVDGQPRIEILEGEIPDIEILRKGFIEDIKNQKKEAKKIEIRNKIQKTAGDTDSILGTTANAAQMLFVAVSTIVTSINKAENLSDVKEGIEPLIQVSEKFLEKVKNKEIILPYTLNNLDDVVDEIGKRANAVSEVLKEVKEKKKEPAPEEDEVKEEAKQPESEDIFKEIDKMSPEQLEQLKAKIKETEEAKLSEQ